MSKLKREILTGEALEKTTSALQATLYDLVDLALQGKQAHWNVIGRNFRSVHLELDEIIALVREGSDSVAERISTLGVAPDGRAGGVANTSRLEAYPEGLQSAEATVSAYSDRLAKAIEGLRSAIGAVGDHDSVSEDLLIGISADLEKQLWMMQAQEA